jgi:hypothetical protein
MHLKSSFGLAVPVISLSSVARFMKLRLDRVLADQFDVESVEEALASNPVDLKFDKPEKWTAPYPKYEFGWWKPFLPPTSSNGTS